MFTVSLNNDSTLRDVFDTDVYTDPDVDITYPITEAEKDMISQSGNMALWQYKDGKVVDSEQASEISKAMFNQEQKKKRVEYYQLMADPVFMKWQRQEATQQEWLDKIEQVKLMFPYQE
jgi:hypothetical protein